MECIGISVVKNEADIVEVFVRHNLQYLSKLFIVSHKCQDNTLEILHKLKNEGLSLEISESFSYRHIQAEEFNRLMQLVREKHAPDFITFLDCDEFLAGDFDLAKLSKDVVSFITWHNYVPQATDDNDINILKRITHRIDPIDHNQHKALIPKAIYANPNAYAQVGGHELYYKTDVIVPAPYQTTTDVHVAHFPLRTPNQIQTKVFVNWLSKLANPLHQASKLDNGKIPSWHHWKRLFDIFKQGLVVDVAQATINTYVTSQNVKDNLCIVSDPVKTNAFVKHEIKELAPLYALADTAEQQAVLIQKLNRFLFEVYKDY